MIVLVPFADRSTVKLVGDAVSVKLPETGAVTVNETLVVCVTPPPVPVTVTESESDPLASEPPWGCAVMSGSPAGVATVSAWIETLPEP